MNVWKKVGALTFVMVLALVLSVSAFADGPAELTNGKVGSASGTTIPTEQPTTVNLKKDLVVYNAISHVTTSNDEETADGKVFAPEFTYTYTVTPASVITTVNVTDEYGTIAPVKAGIIPGLKVGATGTAAASDATSITGTLAFTTSMPLKANASGATNTYDIPLDFDKVTFQQSGVYRYKIEESLTSPASVSYQALSMTDGGMNSVYLDVYVRGDGKIYGYVCLPGTTGDNNGTDNNVAVGTSTNKINGFVRTEDDATPSNGADYYYTYDLKVEKTVTNDSYAQSNHSFPFTVIFTKGSALNTAANFKIYETITQASNGETATKGFSSTNATASAAFTESNTGWSGVAELKHGAEIVYSGIPCGMEVEVYETNNMDGVTYKVTTTKNSDTTNAHVDNSVVSTSTDPSTNAQDNTKEDYQSTKVTFNPTIAEKETARQTCAIDNALVNISPTGVTLRYAPYLLTLGAGITVLPLTRRYKKREED